MKASLDSPTAVRSPRLSRWPIGLALFSLITVGSVATQGSWVNPLNAATGISTDILNVVSLILSGVSWLAWVAWLAFRSGPSRSAARWQALALLMAVAAIPLIWEVEYSGDIRLLGLRPRFWGSGPDLATEASTISPEITLVAGPGDFPQFLGPDRNGLLTSFPTFDTDWEQNPPRLRWKIPVGEGWSGVAIAQGHGVTMEQREEWECVTCYDLNNGELKWIHRNPKRHDYRGNAGYAGPRSTPTIHEGRVYAQGATGTLMCLEGSTGKLLWAHEVNELVASQPSMLSAVLGEQERLLAWGRAASPLIVDDLVIAAGGGNPTDGMHTLLAFRQTSGELVWKGGDQMISYGSPSLLTVAGRRLIAIVGESMALGIDPTNGETLWREEWPGNSTMDANCSQVTQVNNNRILLTKGYSQGGKLVEIDWGQSPPNREVKRNPRALRTKLTNPVVRDGFAYSLSDGFLECVSLEDLSIRWKERTRAGAGQILIADDWIFVHHEDGQLSLVAADPTTYRKLGTIPTVSGICWNTLAAAGNRVIVRSNREMACVELPSSQVSAATSSSTLPPTTNVAGHLFLNNSVSSK